MPVRLPFEQLIAFNDELAALVKAGIPIEQGLVGRSRGWPRAMQRAMDGVGARIEQGQSLDAALAADPRAFPPMYQSVVKAGLRSDKLADALGGLSRAGHRLLELRRVVALAAIYPVIVLAVLFGLLIVMTTVIAPAMEAAMKPAPWPITLLSIVGGHARLWGPGIPLVLLVILLVMWVISRRTPRSEAVAMQPLYLFPAARRLKKNSHDAAFAELLALLIEQRTPLGEAVRLATAAAGDQQLAAEGQQWAESLDAGHLPQQAFARRSSFPPRIGLLLQSALTAGLDAEPLRQAAADYHERARLELTWLKFVLPGLLTVLVGGSAAFIYALLLFGPWTIYLRDMGTMPL